jgi:hypothetical protein
LACISVSLGVTLEGTRTIRSADSCPPHFTPCVDLNDLSTSGVDVLLAVDAARVGSPFLDVSLAEFFLDESFPEMLSAASSRRSSIVE